MVFVPCQDVAHVAFIGETDGQQTVNDLYFISTAPPINFSSLVTLVNTLGTWYGAALGNLYAETWQYSHARGRDLTSQASFVYVSTLGATAGGVAGEQAPSNVSANIVFGTSLAGRNNHGSNRIPGIPNSLVDTNTLDSTFLTDIVNAYADLLAPSSILPSGWTWVNVSRFSGSTIVDGKKVPTPRVAGVMHEIFDVFFPDTIVDSQKTRLPGHGK